MRERVRAAVGIGMAEQRERDIRSQHGIAPDEAHVWRVTLRDAFERTPVDAALTAEERQRLVRLRTPELQRDFIVTRRLLRDVLARYAGVARDTVVLRTDARGKPHLEPACGVCFSLSHTTACAVLAVAAVDVGVDVERVRAVPRVDRLARRVLHEATVRQLTQVRGRERRRVFIDAWTQREAHVKAVGGGLFATPDVLPFDAVQAADGGVRQVTERTGAGQWSVARFTVGADVRGTIVVRGTVRRVLFFDWEVRDGA